VRVLFVVTLLIIVAGFACALLVAGLAR